MFPFVSVLIVIVAIFLVLIVIIQNSKGGGLAAGFASSNQVMGVRKTTDFLEKATWWLAGIMVGLCIIATILLPRNNGIDSLNVEGKIAPAEQQQQNPDAAAPFELPVTPPTE
jgi:preprotein translocase subunit SecG